MKLPDPNEAVIRSWLRTLRSNDGTGRAPASRRRFDRQARATLDTTRRVQTDTPTPAVAATRGDDPPPHLPPA